MIRSGNGGGCEPVPIPNGGGQYVAWFWRLRGFCDDHSEPVKPALVRDWCSDVGLSLTKFEKGIIYAMDTAFRGQYPKTVAHYAEVKARQNK